MKNHIHRLRKIEATAAPTAPGEEAEALRLVSLLSDAELAEAAQGCGEAPPPDHRHGPESMTEGRLALLLLDARPDLRQLAEARAVNPE